MTARAQEIPARLAFLRAADPVLAQLIDDRPDLDPDAFTRRLPAMDRFGALVFQTMKQIGDRGDRNIRAANRAVRGVGCRILASSQLSTPGNCMVSDCPA